MTDCSAQYMGVFGAGGGGLAPGPLLEVKKNIFVLIFNVKNYAKFWTLLKMYI